jgi:hypothetical protein
LPFLKIFLRIETSLKETKIKRPQGRVAAWPKPYRIASITRRRERGQEKSAKKRKTRPEISGKSKETAANFLKGLKPRFSLTAGSLLFDVFQRNKT